MATAGRLLTLVLLVASCGAGVEGGDRVKLEEIRARVGSEFKLTPEGSLYLRAQLRAAGIEAVEGKAREIYRGFFLNADGSALRNDCHFVYLNVYDVHGTFLFQLYFDRLSGAVVKQNRADHY